MPLFLDLDRGKPTVVERPSLGCYTLLHRAMRRHEAWIDDYTAFRDHASAASAAGDLAALRGELAEPVALGAS